MVRDDSEEGLGVVVPAKHWWLPQPEKIGGQLPAGEPLPWHHDGGDAYQELVVRLKLGPPLFGLNPNGLFTIGLFMIGLLPFGLPMMFALSPFGLF